MNPERVQLLMDLVRSELMDRHNSGRINYKMPLDGDVALMLDKLHRFYETRDDTEILGFVVDGLLALNKVVSASSSKTEPLEGIPRAPHRKQPSDAEIMEAVVGRVLPEETENDGETDQEKTEPSANRGRKPVRSVRKSGKASRSK